MSKNYPEVCFVGPVVGENYVWFLVIVVIFMGFGQVGAKRCKDALNSSIVVTMQATRGVLFYREGRFSLCNTAEL